MPATSQLFLQKRITQVRAETQYLFLLIAPNKYFHATPANFRYSCVKVASIFSFVWRLILYETQNAI
jgi:hypothetical protein